MLAELTQILSGYRFRTASEAQLHAGIAAALTAAGIGFEHEKVLASGGRLDFFLPDSALAIEVKIGGSLAEALLQVNRYLKAPEVAGVLVAATRTWARGELPCVQGKPVQLLRLTVQAF